METNYFALQDGKIVHVPVVPVKPEILPDSLTLQLEYDEWYKKALQSAIANSREVENQEKVKNVLMKNGGNERDLHPNTIYPLQCRVELITELFYTFRDQEQKWVEENEWNKDADLPRRKVARVTFDEQPEKELRIGDDNTCPVTKEQCDDECCPPGAICNISGRSDEICPTEPEAAEKGCKCQKCGRQYKVDIMIPDFLWEKVKPEGKSVGAGLLCGSCIADGLEQFGFNAFNLSEAAGQSTIIFGNHELTRLEDTQGSVKRITNTEAAGQEQEEINRYRVNAEEDYRDTPISVLRYISELEKQTRKP